MKIIIDYDSSWRNSFLDGSNNEPLPKKGRKFVASMTNLRNPENFKKHEVTLDTVMGLLNRVIGDQRKLYQARVCNSYYFKGIDGKAVSFQDRGKETSEMTYIRNMSGNTDQNSFTGAIKSNHPMLSSDYSPELWGTLAMSVDEICNFITGRNLIVSNRMSLNPMMMIERIKQIGKEKNILNMGLANQALEKINSAFPELITDKQLSPFLEKSGKIKPIRLYSASLYLQLDRLSLKFDMASATTKAGKVAGFSKRGFNGERDFIKNFVTGGEKTIWGNPYAVKEFKSLKPLMTKASGQLEISIDVSQDKAKEIKGMIEDAGVSSFYLGKKGLAYISSMSTREVR